MFDLQDQEVIQVEDGSPRSHPLQKEKSKQSHHGWRREKDFGKQQIAQFGRSQNPEGLFPARKRALHGGIWAFQVV